LVTRTLGLFVTGSWGHPAYHLPCEVNLLGVAHHLEAPDWQSNFVWAHTILDGKNPHPQSYLATALNLENEATINADRLAFLPQLLQRDQNLVSQVYLPNVLVIASFYNVWATIGMGLVKDLAHVQQVDQHQVTE
jgi:hydrogenase large subunit